MLTAQKALFNYYRLKDSLVWLEYDLNLLNKKYREKQAVSAVDTTKVCVTGGESNSVQEKWVLWLDSYDENKEKLTEAIEISKRRITAIEKTYERYKDIHGAEQLITNHFFKQFPANIYCKKFRVPKQRFFELKREIVAFCNNQDPEVFRQYDPWWLISLNTRDIATLRNMLGRVKSENPIEQELIKRMEGI